MTEEVSEEPEELPCHVATETSLAKPQILKHNKGYSITYGHFVATYEGVDGSACAYSVSSDNTAVTVTTVTSNEVYSLRIAKNKEEGCLIVQT